MNKRISRIIGIVMFVLAVIFVWYALHHPEAGFLWSIAVTRLIYAVYILVMLLFLAAPFKRK